jgi:hypothetical protein
VHYNGCHPAIAKGQDFCRGGAGGVLASSNHFGRATKRLLVGIIDCAFEICENRCVVIARPDVLFRVSKTQKTLNPNSWKDFPQKLFSAKHVLKCLEVPR